MGDFETRFGGIARLYGNGGLKKLRAAQVCVVGVGGVGAWAAEALARSGVGALTLVDLDEVCASNINRQLHALTDTVGRAKVEVMADRIRAINPECRVTAEQQFFNEQTAAGLLAPKFDFVLDAIDSVTNKVLLLAGCRQRKLPVVACGGAGGRRDGTQVRTADLARVSHDRLLARSAEKITEGISIPRRRLGRWVWLACFPRNRRCMRNRTARCAPTGSPPRDGTRLNCNGGLGSATFVTGAFGFAAAGIVVRRIALDRPDQEV